MKHLLFSYGSLVLPENLKKFKSSILKSVFIKGFSLEYKLSPITKTNYHYIFLIKNNFNNNLPGFLIETEDIEAIDKWEGSSYKRIETICYDRYMNKIKCFVYIKNI